MMTRKWSIIAPPSREEKSLIFTKEQLFEIFLYRNCVVSRIQTLKLISKVSDGFCGLQLSGSF